VTPVLEELCPTLGSRDPIRRGDTYDEGPYSVLGKAPYNTPDEVPHNASTPILREYQSQRYMAIFVPNHWTLTPQPPSSVLFPEDMLGVLELPESVITSII
jgi:hypothetical protein